MAHSHRSGVVVFVDRARWTGFDQMAATLRRRGIHVVRLSAEHTAVSRAIDHLVYHETYGFTTDEELRGLLLRFDAPELLDVVTIDDLVRVVTSTPFRTLRPAVLERIRSRAAWVDKLETSRRLAAAGVPVPAVCPADETTAEEAVARLGLPVVVKNRIGAGGKGVRVARSVAEAAAAAAALGDAPAEVFYERFAEGAAYCYAAAFDGERIFDEAAYESRRDPNNPYGPSSQIVVVDDPALLATGRAAVRAMANSGVVNFDVLESQGEYLVVDVNFRVWNAAIMLRGAGCRFDKGYVAAITGVDDGAPTRVGRRNTTVTVFPDAVIHEVAARGVLDLRRLERLARPFVRWAGPRYVTSAAAYTARLWTVEVGIDRGRLLRLLRRSRG